MQHIPHLHWEVLPSTNDMAKQLGRLGGQECFSKGLCVSATRQTAGRGQFQRIWVSEEGGIYLSLLRFPTDGFSGTTALAVAECMQRFLSRRFAVSCVIKPPNDLLIAGKKVCGILVEKVTRGNFSFWVIGVGLNVNQQSFLEVDTAVSLFQLGGGFFDIACVITEIMEALWYEA